MPPVLNIKPVTLQCTGMNTPRNLISDSSLVQETFDLVREMGGRATFVEIADSILRLSHIDADLALGLIADLVRNDPRFLFEETHLAISADERENRPLNEIDFVVIDVEAIVARNFPARIIEIGGYRVRAGQILGQFETLINPEIPLPRFIASLTRISDEMLKQAPVFGAIAEAWLEFAADAVLVAHNSMFDLPLLNREIARIYPGHRMRNAELCTVKLARRIMPHLNGHNLDSLAAYFGFDIPERHRAASDALATARVFLRLLSQLEEGGVHTLCEARSFQSKVVAGDSEFKDLPLALDV